MEAQLLLAVLVGGHLGSIDTSVFKTFSICCLIINKLLVFIYFTCDCRTIQNIRFGGFGSEHCLYFTFQLVSHVTRNRETLGNVTNDS